MNEFYRFKSKTVEYLFLIRENRAEKKSIPRSIHYISIDKFESQHPNLKLCARDLVLPPYRRGLASYPGAQRGGAEEERKKERLVSTARACAKCSFILL